MKKKLSRRVKFLFNGGTGEMLVKYGGLKEVKHALRVRIDFIIQMSMSSGNPEVERLAREASRTKNRRIRYKKIKAILATGVVRTIAHYIATPHVALGAQQLNLLSKPYDDTHSISDTVASEMQAIRAIESMYA